MIDQEFKNIVTERFLELTDRFAELKRAVSERGNFIFLDLSFSFSPNDTQSNRIKFTDFTPVLLQEIIKNCEFIKNYFELAAFSLQTITLTKFRFLFTVKYRKTKARG